MLPCIDRIMQTVNIDTFTVDIEERGVKLRLTVVDTPGFGDAVDNKQWRVHLYVCLSFVTHVSMTVGSQS